MHKPKFMQLHAARRHSICKRFIALHHYQGYFPQGNHDLHRSPQPGTGYTRLSSPQGEELLVHQLPGVAELHL
jgi:hypothetical protein